MKKSRSAKAPQIIAFILSLHLLVATGFATTRRTGRKHRRAGSAHAAAAARQPVVTVAARTSTRVIPVQAHKAAIAGPPPAPAPAPPVIAGGPWTSPTYADSTDGDNVDGEDLEIRRAAVDSLGQYNGSVVVVDAVTGRVLSMVNQKVALSTGFQPCSTVKVSVALAALSEKVIQPSTRFRLGGMRMNLTYALAHSNNYYFATLGEKLGFERVAYYARLFGYGSMKVRREMPAATMCLVQVWQGKVVQNRMDS